MAIVRVQSAQATTLNTPGGTTVDVVLSGVAAGNLLVVVLTIGNATAAGGTPVQTFSGPATTWTLAKNDVGNDYVAIYYALNVASGSYTIRGTAASATSLTIFAAEYSGPLTAGALDAVAGTSGGSSTAVDSGVTATTAQAAELVVGGASWSAVAEGSFTPTNGNSTVQSNLDGAAGAGGAMLEQIVSSTGTYRASGTLGSADFWGAVVATFKATTVAVGTPPRGIVTAPTYRRG